MQDRFERFVVSITELHRYLPKLKELEMGQMTDYQLFRQFL